MRPHDLLTDVADLVLGRRCLRCEAVGSSLCGDCLAGLRGAVHTVPPSPGLPPTTASLPYDDGRLLVLEYKERGNRGLAPMLGTLLADAIEPHLPPSGTAPVVVVPVPSHRWSARGFDALGGITRCAARTLGTRGARLLVRPWLTTASAYRPLKDLSREERRQRIDGAFAVPAPIRGLERAGPPPRLIVVDDVLTTGATVGEAVRTLAGAGIRASGIAVVAWASPGRSVTSRAPARPTSRR
jgi:predicted amidophosphoribosyltransferase